MEEVKMKESQERMLESKGNTLDYWYSFLGRGSLYQCYVSIMLTISTAIIVFYLYSLPLYQIFPEVEGCANGVCKDASEACKEEFRSNYRYRDRSFNFLSEYDLICWDVKASLIFTIYSIGFSISSIILGAASDSVGRLPVLYIGQCGFILCTIGLVSFSSYISCLICSGLIGICIAALFSPMFSYAFDSAHTESISYYTFYLNLMWSLSEIVVALIMSTGIRWRTMSIITLCVATLLFFMYPLLTESPRFWYSKNQPQLAIHAIQHIARVNNKMLPHEVVIFEEADQESSTTGCRQVFSLLTQKWLLLRLLLCAVVYFNDGYTFYGLSMAVQRFGGNVYFNAILNGVAEALAYITSYSLSSKVQAKYSLCFSLALCGVALIVQYFTLDSVIISSISMYFGKFGVSASFNIIYTQAGLLFPTSIRNSVLGILTVVERIGAILGPLLGIIPALFLVVAVALAFASLFAAWMMPKPTQAPSVPSSSPH